MTKQKNLINTEYSKLYPLSKPNFDSILSFYDTSYATNKIISKDLIIFGTKKNRVAIFNRMQPLKTPTIKKILTTLSSSGIHKCKIILSEYSTGCLNAISSFNNLNGSDYELLKIVPFLSSEMQKTVPVSFGRYTRTTYCEPGVSHKNVTVRVPENGYPELDISGPISSKEIYEIIEIAKKNKSNSSNDEIDYKKGYEVIFAAFEKMTMLLNSEKNITPKRWNDILTSTGVFDFMEED